MSSLQLPPPCFAFLRSEMIEAKGGRAKVRFRPSPEMENPYGIIQGGILAAMIDNIVGPAVVATVPDRPTATIQMSVHYLGKVTAADTLIGEARIVKLGRMQAVIEATLARESDGDIVTRATLTNVFLDPSPGE